MFAKLRSLQRLYASTPPTEIARLLDEEERNGARVGNRIRYVIGALLGLVAVINLDAPEDGDVHVDALVNLGATAAYFGVTFAHSLALSRMRDARWLSVANLGALFIDYLLIVLVSIYYAHVYSWNNWSFILKNTVFYYILIPFALTAVQFRLRTVLIATGALLLIVGALVWKTLVIDQVQQTNNWFEYVMGPAVVAEDLFVSRLVLIAGLSLILLYVIYRARLMVRRVGLIEQQKSQLSRYFSPEIAAEILERPDELSRGGRRTLSVLFSDIRGFTSMSEGLTPDELVQFLGEYRERMTASVFAHGGALDKFVGDAVMAIFGAPRSAGDAGDDARAAIACARDMLLRLREYNGERAASGRPPVYIGIGVHTGEAFAGNVGSGERLEYTVIGDAVNTGARIESLCKKLDAALLISETTWRAAGEPAAEKMPRVMVRGKSEPLQTYRLAGLQECVTAKNAQSSSVP